MNMMLGWWRRGVLGLMAVVAGLGGRADGFIVVHEPIIIPGPPVVPGPRPPGPYPLPRPIPPPRTYTFAPLEVVFHHVDVQVHDQVATTRVDQEFRNPNDRQLEGTYLFPVPAGARIDRFSMEVNGREVEAELVAADRARQLYEDIVRRHRDPALLEYVGRDLFKVRIFPIEPRSRKRVKLSYTELLRAEAGLVTYRYPLNTERFSARPIESVRLRVEVESSRPLKSVYSPSHAVDITRKGERRATVGFEAAQVKPDTDFQLLMASDVGEVGVNLLTHPGRGEEGFFLLLASPGFQADARRILPKDVVLVLDTSGSMAGPKLEQARKALRFCVENLNDQDRFDVVRFSTEAEALFEGVVEATRAQRDRAWEFIRDLKPIGGTAIHEALERALGLLPAGTERPRTVVFLTDGLPTVGETDLDRIVDAAVRKAKAGGGQTRVFSFGIGHDVNTHLLDRLSQGTQAASEYVLPDEDLEVKVSRFFSKVKDPVLAGVRLTFPEGVRVTKVHPSPLPDLFQGEQLVVVGRYRGEGSGPLVLEGAVGGAVRRFEYQVGFPGEGGAHEFIPRLWATRRIGHLLEEIRLRGEQAELRDEIVALAREHGIVTPYTAFLILEDEERRGVPLAQQSVPHLRGETAQYQVAREAFGRAPARATGAQAVAAARYGQAQKRADQVDVALSAAGVEAQRLLAPAAGGTPAAPTAPPRTGAGRGGVTGPPAGVTLAGSREGQPAEGTAAGAVASRFVGGRTFFQNGDQWLDATVQQARGARQVRVQFNSPEYFALVLERPEVRPWLALGQRVQFVLGDTVYEVYE